MYNEKRRSGWWFLLPIFLNIVGGVIAYFVLRHDDPQKAKNCLLLGIVLFVIQIGIGYILEDVTMNTFHMLPVLQ